MESFRNSTPEEQLSHIRTTMDTYFPSGDFRKELINAMEVDPRGFLEIFNSEMNLVPFHDMLLVATLNTFYLRWRKETKVKEFVTFFSLHCCISKSCMKDDPTVADYCQCLNCATKRYEDSLLPLYPIEKETK